MHQFYASMALIGAVAFVLALLTHALKARIWWASAPLLATAAGIVFGPDVLGWLRPQEWGDPHGILLEVARIAIAMAAMSIALRVPGGFWRGYPGTMALVLTLGMLAMWTASALLSWWLLPWASRRRCSSALC